MSFAGERDRERERKRDCVNVEKEERLCKGTMRVKNQVNCSNEQKTDRYWIGGQPKKKAAKK